MTRVVAIHQPNFFPWLGYFDKIARSDVFIFLDDVQFPKTGGGTWSNRVKMLLAGESRWVTAPIHRTFQGVAQINEIEWADELPWRAKLLKTMSANYAKAPHYRDIMAWLEPLILQPEANLARYNMTAIKAIAERIGLRNDHCVTSSSLGAQGQASELLIDLTLKVGGDCYLCGGGASGYQDDEVFVAAGVELRYQSFAHPIYTQHGVREFVPGLSIVDALMNLGFEGARQLLRHDAE
jgi:hypothetical protein